MKLLSRIDFLNEDIDDPNLTEKDLDFWFAKLKKEHPKSYYYDVIRKLVYSITSLEDIIHMKINGALNLLIA